MQTNNPASAIIRSLLLPVFLPSVLMSITEYSLLPIIPSTAHLLGADLPTAGVIAGLLMLGVVVTDLPAGRLVDHYGERRSMIFGALAGALGVVLVAFSNSLVLMGVGVFAVGIGVAIFALARHAFFAEHIPLEYRARALSLLGGTFRAGSFIGPLIASGLVVWLGIESVYWFAGLTSAAAGVIILSTKPDAIKATPASAPGGVLAVAKAHRKQLLTVGLGAAIIGVVRTTRQIGLPLWALFIGLAPEESTFYIGLAAIIDFALFYASGQIMDRYGRFWASVPPLIGLAIAHLLTFTATNGISFLVLAVAMALANGFGSGVILTIGADLAPAGQRNEFLASYRLITDVGVAAAPPALSALASGIGLAAGMASFGVVGFVGVWLLWRYLPVYIPKSN